MADHGPTLEPSKVTKLFAVFFVAVAANLFVGLAIYRFIAPNAFHADFLHPWKIVLWTFLLGLPLSLFEYLYHRYLLHSAIMPFVSSMQRAHLTHHGLTNVKAPVRASDPEKHATVTSEYPIEERRQEESMMFPLYSGIIFIFVFELLFGLPIKFIFSGQPIVASMMFSGILYYSAYEVWHALLHLPFEEFWEPWMKRAIGRRIYGFHLMHHWRPTANQAIVGLWGFAIWDHLFGTHRRSPNMPLDNASVTYLDSKLRKPRWPISTLDRWQGSLARSARRLEHSLARIFLRRRPADK